MTELISNVESLTVSVDAGQTQAIHAALAPWLMHDAELGRLESPTPDTRRVTLHPRITAQDALPESVRDECQALGAQWGARTFNLTPAQRVRVYTVVFFSKSKASTPLRHGLPDTWRRVLSNFHRAELSVEGVRYASVEHFFQARKALCATQPHMARWFELDNTSPEAVGADPAAAKKAGGRGAYKRVGAVLDQEAWLTHRVPAMRAALEARWAQQPLFRAVLESTRGLDLLHFERAGAGSFWGGNISRSSGLVQGENQLGALLTALRTRSDNEA